MLNTTCPPNANFDHGGKCDFRCEDNNKLVGPDVVTCDDGKWAEIQLNMPKCERRECQDISKQVKSGQVKCPARMVNGKKMVPIGETCSIECQEGKLKFLKI